MVRSVVLVAGHHEGSFRGQEQGGGLDRLLIVSSSHAVASPPTGVAHHGHVAGGRGLHVHEPVQEVQPAADHVRVPEPVPADDERTGDEPVLIREHGLRPRPRTGRRPRLDPVPERRRQPPVGGLRLPAETAADRRVAADQGSGLGAQVRQLRDARQAPLEERDRKTPETIVGPDPGRLYRAPSSPAHGRPLSSARSASRRPCPGNCETVRCRPRRHSRGSGWHARRWARPPPSRAP